MYDEYFEPQNLASILLKVHLLHSTPDISHRYILNRGGQEFEYWLICYQSPILKRENFLLKAIAVLLSSKSEYSLRLG